MAPVGFLSPVHTPEDGLNAQHELLGGERLCDIVVGTELEAVDPVLFCNLGSHENHGNIHFLSELAHEIETVSVGKHDILDQKVGFGDLEGLAYGRKVAEAQDLVACKLQIASDAFANHLMVFHNVDQFHGFFLLPKNLQFNTLYGLLHKSSQLTL